MSKKNIFNEALNDLKEVRNTLTKKVTDDIIKENEEKINNAVSKLMSNDGEEETDDLNVGDEVAGEDLPITTDTEVIADVAPEGDEIAPEVSLDDNTTPVEIKNVEFIDQLLNSLNIADAVKSSDVEINVSDNPESTEEPTNDEEVLDVNDEELEEYHNLKNNNNSTINMENNKEEMIKDEKSKQDQAEIKTTLKEIEDALGEEKPSADSDVAPDAGDWSNLDEELMKELEAMDEEDIKGILKEIEDETSPEAKPEEEEELEEGMSITSQTHKEVGGKNFPHREGKPERRSNMSEGVSKEEFAAFATKVDALLKENKDLKAKNTELKDINSKYVKKIEETNSKLYEAAIMSHKIAYVNQLFLEHSLNQKDKKTILEKFKDVDTIEQSKKTYGILKEEFSNRTVIRESIEDKITKTTVQGEATKLSETKVSMSEGLDPKLKKMQDLINFETKKRKI